MNVISLSAAIAIETELCAEYGLIVLPKSGPIFTVVGAGFDVARVFGARVPTGETFNRDYSTMLPLVPIKGLPRALVTVPVTAVEPYARIARMAHEAKHSDQFLNPEPGESAWAWGARYASNSRFRASQEAGGYLVNYALDWATGRTPVSPDGVAHVVTNGYALEAHDRRLVRDLIEMDAASIDEGIVRCKVARLVIRRLVELEPAAVTEAAKAAVAEWGQ